MRPTVKNIVTFFCATIFFVASLVIGVSAQTTSQLPVSIDAVEMKQSPAPPSSIFSGDPDAQLPVLLRANTISQDRDLGIIVAKGNVEIAQGARVLFADVLSYNQKLKTVTASGNVTFMEPAGTVMFASYVELTDNLKDGIVEEIKILLNDNARISANGAKRSNGNRTDMVKAVYSPCEICKDNPLRPPLWQVKAKQVVHDQHAQQIEYHSATMEIAGVPIIYTPYFSHPDPSVKRETGLLTPKFGTASNLGFFAQIPYFLVLGKDKDITFDPIYTSDEGLFYSGEYRQRFNNGEIKFSASAGTADRIIGQTANGRHILKKDEWRGHIFSRGQFDLNETWRTGFDIDRATDQSYLRKFDFWETPNNSSSNSLTSNLYAEGFRQRNYMAANAYSFQDLRSGNRPNTPLIFPLLDYSGLGEADKYGGRWSLDGNFRALSKKDTADSARMSVIGGYEVPFTSNTGYVTTLSTNLRGDTYYTKQHSATDSLGRTVKDGAKARIHGNLGLDWRYPLARNSSWGYQIFEPIVSLFAAPDRDVATTIRNDDSTVIESDDTNLFSANRAPGLDIIEGGIRSVYGFKIANYFSDAGQFRAFLGQSYKFSDTDPNFTKMTKLEERRSDIVGKMIARTNKYLNLNYRFAIDETEHKFNRNELGFSLGVPALRLSGDYTYVRDQNNSTKPAVDEIKLAAASKIDDYWSARVHLTKDLIKNNATRKAGLGISYEDECLLLSGKIERDYTKGINFSTSDSIFFLVSFKTLGDVDLAQ